MEEAYWDPEGYQAYKFAMFNNGHSIKSLVSQHIGRFNGLDRLEQHLARHR